MYETADLFVKYVPFIFQEMKIQSFHIPFLDNADSIFSQMKIF